MADIQGTNGDDIIKGGRGDDFIDGLDGDDRITDVWGDNTINGGGGNDRILASQGVDVVDGGSGSDRIWTRHGDDTATYRLSENLGAEDYYDGGHGTDTLRLVLTAEEAQDPAVQATIEAVRSFIEDDPDPNNSGQQPTTFTFSLGGADANLTLRNFENLEIVIEDDDQPGLSIDDPEVTEGDPGDNTTITFTVTRSGDNGAESTVDYAVLPGSATTPSDYAPPDPLTGTLTFAAGETAQTVTLNITEDDVPEQTETFTVELSAPTNAAITKGIGTGTILDDDQPSLSINDPEVTEGDPGDNTTIAFTVTRTGDNGAESTVDYSVLPGTATTPGDYAPPAPLTGTLTFAAGETEQTVTLNITEDDVPEQTETFTVALSAPTNAAITKGIGTGTILDDDQPSLSIDDPEVTEGDPGDDTTITFTVTRSGDNGAESTVDYAVLPGTATTPGDYAPPAPLTGTLTFAAGETEQTVTLNITEDDVPEQTETFTVELSAPTNAAITKGIGTGTILDDDQPSLSIDDPEVTEGDPGDDTTITFTVTRSGDNGAESTVGYAVLPGTATTPGDYAPPAPLTGTLTFGAGETEQTVTLNITEDDAPEQTETFTVELSAPTNAAITKGIGTGTILDDDQPGLSIDDPEVTEGDPGDNTTITFTVTRSGDNGAASTVDYSVLPGTATTPSDYAPPDPLTGTLTFAAGETEQTVTLNITEDDVPEQTETFTVELSAPTNAAITKGIGTGTILDDDQPSLSIDDPEVTEGDPGDDTTITFTVTRSGDNGAASTVDYSVLPGSATTPSDYAPPAPLTGTLTFAAGETEQTVTLNITEDDAPEQTETFTVELSAPTNAEIVKGIGTGTILDDDQPGLSIDDPEVTEGDPGDDTTITFTVTRSGDNGAESTVDYSVLPGTATTPSDYAPPDPLTGTLTFAAGETEKTVTLNITEDDAPEQTETFTVELSAPTNAAITKGIGTGTILDDDQPGLSINDPEVTEGDPGDDTTITFTVTRSGDNGAESTVDYSVLPGSATTPGDYAPPAPLTGTLTFAAGETEQTVTLNITEDDVPEQTETFTVELSAPTNAAITKGIGTGTILDDDQPGLSINDPEVTEGDPGDDTTITFTVTRSGDNGAASTVDYSVLPGTATTPSDYAPPAPLTGTLTFAAGETEQTVTLNITEDDAPEQTETFTVALSAPTNAAITKGIGTGTILDDDQPSLSIDDPEVTEGDPGDNTTIAFTVTRTGDNGAESTVDYSVLPGTATTPGDYAPPAPLTGTLTFAAGETEQTVTLNITEDDVPEQTETFTVELSAPTNAAITKGIGTGTILDDDQPSLSINDPEVTEGDPGDNTTIAFTVTRTGDNGAESTVDYSVLPGTATTPGDYAPPAPLTGTLTFAAGETEQTVTLNITEDDVPEQTETFTVALSAPTNAAITKGIGTGTILDDDQPSLSIDDPEVTEGDPGDDTTITFTVTRSGDNGAESTVDYAVLPGTATTPGDYAPPAPLTGTLTFAAGETEQTVTLNITEDDVPEQTETFTVELSAPTNAAITKGIGTGTILDDDQPSLSIDDPEVTEGDPGDDTTITFTVTRSGDNGAESTVGYAVLPGTATTPGDYAPPAPLTGTLTFGAGETEQTVTLNITEDDAPEQTETFTVELSAPTNAAITKGIGTGTILDDDQPGLSIDDPEVTEGDPGDNTTITFTVTRSGDNGAASTVDYSVLPGTATTPSDYAPPDPLTGTLTFAAGETEKTVTLNITEDDAPEQTETFTVELSAPTNAAITKGIGTGTILDDDQPSLSIDDPEVTEGDPGDDTTITFTVTRSGDNGAASTVDYSVLPGTATTPSDYAPPAPLTGTLTFAAGETEQTVTLNITEDDAPEQTETFTVELSAPTNAAITKGIGTGTIEDDDLPEGIIWQNGGNITIGSEASPSVFDIGTDASAPTVADLWTGFTVVDTWSENGNWQDVTKPIATDEVVFDNLGPSLNIVDENFEIASLNYSGAASYITDLDGVNTLGVNGSAGVGIANSDNTGALVIRNATSVTANITELNVGLESSGSGITRGFLLVTNAASLTADADTISIGRETGTASSSSTAADGSLTLGTNSTITLGSAAALATLNIGWSENINPGGFASGSATGVFDALEKEAVLDLNLSELNVGRGSSRGVGTGTLKWDQTEVITAPTVTFGRGNSTGILEVPAGGEFYLGTAAAPISALRIAYNDAGNGTATADLDFTVSNPTFTAFIADDLSIGRETGTNSSGNSNASGSLALGSNSSITLGSTAAPVTLNIGWSENINPGGFASGSATGVFDALEKEAVLDLNLSELNVGRGSSRGVGTGTLKWDQTEVITAPTVTFGRGNSTGILEVPAGGEFYLGTAAAPISALRIAYNDAGNGTATADLDFTVSNPTFTAFIADDLSIGRETGTNSSGNSNASGSLALGSNSSITLGSTAAPVTLNIGWSENTNPGGFASGSATGVFDALEKEAVLDLNLSELNVGRGSSRGVGTGTLKWDQTEVITAPTVTFGRGNSTGILEVPAGGEFYLGTAAAPISALRIAYNDAGNGTATADLDFTVSNPTFTAFIADDLSIGRETGTNSSGNSNASGSLALGSNSSITLGSTAAPVTLNIGWSENINPGGFASGSATGVFDALEKEAVLDLNLSELNVGRGSSRGVGTGTLKWDQTEVITAPTVTFGRGNSTGILEVPAGGEFYLGTAAAPISALRIAYNDAGNGTATADLDFTVSNPTFTAFIADDLSIGRETGTNSSGNSNASGSLALGSNSSITLGSTAAPVTLNIGWSENINPGGFASGSATGVFDALEKEAVLDLNLSELNVGRGSSRGVGTGTLKWDQTEVITAPTVTFGRGNSTGILEVPAGGEFYLGTAAAPISALRIAYNDAGNGTATADLDFTVSNPTFTAFIADDLSIGRETGTNSSGNSNASGSLALGSNSSITLGSTAAPVTLNIGWSENINPGGFASGSATGVFDALEKEAVLDLNLSELNVGRGSSRGVGTGTLKWDQTEVITAPTVTFGRGNSTGILEVPAGGEFYLGTAAAPISALRIAYNDAGNGTATADLDFTVSNPTFTAFIADDLSIGRETGTNSSGNSNASGSLALGSNSSITLGSTAAPVTLNIGWSENINPGGFASGSATGVFDALEKEAVLDLNLSELNVGRGSSRGVGTGTLKWDQTEVITAPTVTFGRGNSTGILEVPAGGEFYLGTAAAPISALRIAYNDAGNGTATADLDFTVSNPTFTAFIADDLSIGRETGTNSSGNSNASGSLALGSNSSITLGSTAAPVTLNIGWSENINPGGFASGSATGVFDALEKEAVLDLNLSELNVGRGSSRGVGTGTLKWDQTEVITAPTVTFGRGNSTGILEVPAGGEFYLGTAAAPISALRIAYNDAGNGTATADLDFTVSNPTFTAFIADDLSIGRETGTNSSGNSNASGSLALGSNSSITLGSTAAPVTLNIGWSENINPGGFASGSATGVFDALEKEAVLDLNLSELNVGRGSSRGVGTGTLKWDQTEVITAPTVTFGRGNSTGILEVPAGGEFYLGTAAAPISALRIAYNDAGNGTATADLDFTVSNPTFTAFIADDLSIGRETGTNSSGNSNASGSLALGSNSSITLGSTAAPVTLNIGWSENINPGGFASGSATGVFDALEKEAVLDLNLSELNVGRGSSRGVGTGTLKWDQTEVITAPTVTFGRGNSTGILEVPAGGEFYLGTAAAPISALRIAYNDAGNGTATADLDFTVSNPTFTAFIADDLSIGRETGTNSSGNSNASGSLALGSNSSITLGSTAAPVTLNIGWSENINPGGFASGSATGVFDALEKEAVLDLNLSELNVGRGSSRGVGTGTLKWDQTEVITAPTVTFGRGNSTGILEVPAGGEFYLGTAAAPISALRIAYNDAGNGTATADLDFTVSNPTFTAFIADDLSIGRETGTNSSGNSNASGSLALGSNSSITLGSTAAPVTLNIGWSENINPGGFASGSATGVFDTTEGMFMADLSTLRIGHTSNRGTASGDFTVGDGVTLNSEVVNIGVGSGATGTLIFLDNFTGTFTADTVNLSNGLFDFNNNTLTIDSSGNILVTSFNLTGGTLQGDTVDYDDTTGTFNFTSGTLSVDTFNGTLDQNGGTLAPGNTPGITTVNGNYSLDSAGTIAIEMDGATTVGVDFDQLQVNGTVNLNADVGAGGVLDVVLGYTPTAGDSFTIIDNDASDLIVGFFDGLPQLGTFDVVNGADTVTFTIDYAGGDGNDVALEATAVNPTATVTTVAALTADDAGTQGPMTSARNSPIVELVPDEDVLVFAKNTPNPMVANIMAPPAPPALAMFVGLPNTAGIVKEQFSVDDVDQGIDSGIVDDLDLIGLPSESGLSHDLYV